VGDSKIHCRAAAASWMAADGLVAGSHRRAGYRAVGTELTRWSNERPGQQIPGPCLVAHRSDLPGSLAQARGLTGQVRPATDGLYDRKSTGEGAPSWQAARCTEGVSGDGAARSVARPKSDGVASLSAYTSGFPGFLSYGGNRV